MTYEEFIAYAKAHYSKGGDSFYECWDKGIFDDYVKDFGAITKRKALSMFKVQHAVQKDMEGLF